MPCSDVAVRDAHAVYEFVHKPRFVVDGADGRGKDRARHIDDLIFSLAVDIAVSEGVCVHEKAGDFPTIVDAEHLREETGRRIDQRPLAPADQKAVKMDGIERVRTGKLAGDIPLIVDIRQTGPPEPTGKRGGIRR